MPPCSGPTLDRDAIDRVIRRHIAELRKPGALTARPGWKITDGQITGQPAIVVTVQKKKKGVPSSSRLPTAVGGIAVDVRQATPLAELRLVDPEAHAIAIAHTRGVPHEPVAPHERRISDGKRLSSIKPARPKVLASAAKKPFLPYTPAPKAPLRAVTRPMSIVACASPDAGFTVLSDFLSATKSQLTVGLYDFTSAKLLETMTALLQREKPRLSLVLDHPGLNPTADQTDDETVAALRKAEPSASIVHALTRSDPWASAWSFLDYHIKVAVRDSRSFWLSSGNWNVSNQPDFAAHDNNDGMYQNADRDWHVIIMDEGLARLFEAYIQHDHTVASAHQTTPDRDSLLAITNAAKSVKEKDAARLKEKNEIPRVPFATKPRTFAKARVTVQPLLTPDKGRRTTMYVEHVLALINSAKKTLRVQMQYFEPSELPDDKPFMQLLNAVCDARARGVDVQLIAGAYEGPHLEAMHDLGLTPVLRIQQNVHNKGIVVDSQQVLVSSQNWSAAGTLRNRDAGVIIRHAGIAQYFEQIFAEDWEKRAKPALAQGAASPAGTAAKSPPGRKATGRSTARTAAKKTVRAAAKKRPATRRKAAPGRRR